MRHGMPPATSRDRILVAAVAGGATLLLVLGAAVWVQVAGARSSAATTGPTTSPGPTSTAPTAHAPIPPSSPAPSFTPRPTVALSAPQRIEVATIGLDAPVEEYTDAMVEAANGWVDPPRRDTVAWWSGGGTPGDPADNTVYLYGHVSQREAVFNHIAELRSGDTIALTTATGTLRYEVVELLPPMLKEHLPTTPEITQATPGRLVLVGCHRDPDQGSRPTTRNTVVIAQQVFP